jgi:hypothetical protein
MACGAVRRVLFVQAWTCGMSTPMVILTIQKSVTDDKADVVIVITSSVEELDTTFSCNIADVRIVAEEACRVTPGAD